jgi:hypothetical protein
MSMNSHRPAGHPAAEELKAYVDEELVWPRRQSVQRHVQGCAACAEEVRVMRRIGDEIKGMEGALEPPAGLRERVLASVEFVPEGTRRVAPFRLLQIGAVTMAVAICAVVANESFKGSEGQLNRMERAPVAAQQAQQSRGAPAGGGGAAAKSAPEMMRQRQAAQVPAQSRPGGGAAASGEIAQYPRMEPEVAGRRNGDSFIVNPTQDYDEITRQPDTEFQVRRLAKGGVSPQVPVSGSSTVTPEDVKKYTRGKEIADVRRKVVQTADLTVRVNRPLEELQTSIGSYLKELGGYMESATLTSPESGERVAQMALRTPVEKFEDTLAYLSKWGEVKAKNLRGEDVTGTWIDQRAELREMRKEEARLAKAYNAAKKEYERQQIRWQLLALRPRIAALEERFALTSKLAALATIQLTLVEAPQARIRGNLMNDLDNTTRAALAAFLVALRVPASAFIWLVVFSPLWVPCVLLYRWAARMARAQQAAPRRDPPGDSRGQFVPESGL